VVAGVKNEVHASHSSVLGGSHNTVSAELFPSSRACANAASEVQCRAHCTGIISETGAYYYANTIEALPNGCVWEEVVTADPGGGANTREINSCWYNLANAPADVAPAADGVTPSTQLPLPPHHNMLCAPVASAVVGGTNHTVATARSAVVGGYDGRITGENSVILGGSGNTVEGEQAVVVGGHANTASGDNSAVLGGQNSEARGANSVVVGGKHSKALAEDAVVMGALGTASHQGSIVLSTLLEGVCQSEGAHTLSICASRVLINGVDVVQQLALLEELVEAVEGAAATKEADVETIEGKIASVTTTMGTLQGYLDTMKGYSTPSEPEPVVVEDEDDKKVQVPLVGPSPSERSGRSFVRGRAWGEPGAKSSRLNRG